MDRVQKSVLKVTDVVKGFVSLQLAAFMTFWNAAFLPQLRKLPVFLDKGRKFFIFAMFFLVAWTFTKIPYYIQFNKDGDSAYEKGGLTGSINLYYWVPGFESSKLHSPACNFLLVHIAFGSTVLIMMALALIKTAWRRKYGYYFFSFAILLGVHTIPAAWTMGKPFLKYLFTATCIWVIVAAVWGFYTLQTYNDNPEKAERALMWEYGWITLGAYGAGFAEGIGILSKFLFKAEHGVFRTYTERDPLFGHSVYDKLPEKVGMTFFFAWAAVVWFYWPIKLAEIDTSSTEANSDERDSESATLIDFSESSGYGSADSASC